jgi:hypothetical protein
VSLADWFRRHRNVFSVSAREVAVSPGDDDMRPLDVSEDEVADGEPPSRAGEP